MLKKLLFAAVGVAIVVGAIVYIKFGQFSAMGEAAENMLAPPETVTTMSVDEAQWEQLILATATVSAVQGVTVSAEVGGRVVRIAFESGAVTEKGDISSEVAHAIPAAPRSWIPSTRDLANSSSVASMITFSCSGSPA